VLFLSLACISLIGGCQLVGTPLIDLSDEERATIEDNLFEEAPEISHPVHATYGNVIELLGYDIEPAGVIRPGQAFTISAYYRAMEPIEKPWKVFVHLDGFSSLAQTNTRQGFDHDAINNLYPTSMWEPGYIVRDTFSGVLREDFENTEVVIHIGFWDPTARERGNRRPHWAAMGVGFMVDRVAERMVVTNPGTGSIQGDQEGPQLAVGSFRTGTEEARRIQAPSLQNAVITVDGALDEVVWQAVRRSDPFVYHRTGQPGDDLLTDVRVLWDEEAIYFGLSMHDTDITATATERDDELWHEDSVEIFLDPLGDGRDYVQIIVNPLATVFDAVFTSQRDRDTVAGSATDFEGLEVARSITGSLNDPSAVDSRWTVEARLPWAALPGFDDVPHNGTTISANFARHDFPGGTTLAWSPVTGADLHRTANFGEIHFVDQLQQTSARAQAQNDAQPERIDDDDQEGVVVRSLEGMQIRLPEPVVPNRVRPLRERLQAQEEAE